jgi:hypothetical protein
MPHRMSIRRWIPTLTAALFPGLFWATIAAASEPFQFVEVTSAVVDKNPPGLGNVFDYAFMDINDDNLLDIVLNNHHRGQPTPMYLGTIDHKFKFWQNFPDKHATIAGFWLGEVDQNGDGKTDLIHTGNEGGVIINLNTSEKGESKPSYKPIHIKSSSRYVNFLDLDGDGALETLIRPGLVFKGITKKPIQTGVFHGIYAIGDFNNDGWPDLFSPGLNGRRAHWNGPRRLYKNNKGNLEEIKQDSEIVSQYLDGFVRTGDFNNDGNTDIYIFSSKRSVAGRKNIVADATTNTTGSGATISMQLFLGDGKFGFRDVSKKAGIAESTQKAGYSHVYLADIDNDSFIDIVNQGNYGTRCWRNNGDATFTQLDPKNTKWLSGKHMRFGDYDMDGRLDIVTGGPGPSWKSRPTSVAVYRNITDNKNKWLKVQLRQTDKNTMAIGAIVTLKIAGTHQIIGKKMMLCDTAGNHPRLHFGLGVTDKVDIEVTFPTAKEKKLFRNIAANRYVVLRLDGSVTDIAFGS